MGLCGFVQTQNSPGIILYLNVELANLESDKLLKMFCYLVYDSRGKSKTLKAIILAIQNH